jgi:hypothetical protein
MTNRRAVSGVVLVAIVLMAAGRFLFRETEDDLAALVTPFQTHNAVRDRKASLHRNASAGTTMDDADSRMVSKQVGSSVALVNALSPPTAQAPAMTSHAAGLVAEGDVARATCVQKDRTCAFAWASHVEPPADEGKAVFKFRGGNACGYGRGDLMAMAKGLLRSHQLQMHGDSTLREMIKVLIKFVGVNGNLEKKDANKNQREARYFDEQLENIGGRVRMAYRFDHLPANVNEPFLTLPDTFRGTPRVDVVCMGVHMADHELVDLKTPYEAAVARMPSAVIGNFSAYLTTVNADPSVTAVVVLLQDLECEQMGRSVLEQFRKRAPFCPNIAKYVERYNAVFLDFLKREPVLARKVVVMGPFNCGALKPKGSSCKGGNGACACTKDGIHLRTRYLKLRVEAFIHTVSRASACSTGS